MDEIPIFNGKVHDIIFFYCLSTVIWRLIKQSINKWEIILFPTIFTIPNVREMSFTFRFQLFLQATVADQVCYKRMGE